MGILQVLRLSLKVQDFGNFELSPMQERSEGQTSNSCDWIFLNEHFHKLQMHDGKYMVCANMVKTIFKDNYNIIWKLEVPVFVVAPEIVA